MANDGLKDVSVAQRQIYILSLLSENHRGYTIAEIADRLKQWDINVTNRTVMRDIDDLSMNYSVSEDERDGKTYFFADKFNLKNVDLTITDMMSIVFMEKILVKYSGVSLGKNAIEMLEKMKKETDALNQLHMQALEKMFADLDAEDHKNSDVDPEVERDIRACMEKRCKVKIRYHSFSGDQATERVIYPLKFILIDDYLNVEAYCELRSEIRRFRLSRMEILKMTDVHFEVPEEALKGKSDLYFKYISGENPENIEIVFSGMSARYVKEYQKDLADHIIENKSNQTITFIKRAAITDEVVRFVMGFGAEAKVIKPESLKDRIKEEATKISAQYK